MTAPIPTPDVRRYADVERLLAGWLRGVLGYPNITHDLPGNLTFVLPLIVLWRYGGDDPVPTLDEASIDLDVFAADYDAAKDHAASIRSNLRSRLPGYVADGTVVKWVRTTGAPAKRPWDSRGVYRIGATYRIRLHQFSGV